MSVEQIGPYIRIMKKKENGKNKSIILFVCYGVD